MCTRFLDFFLCDVNVSDEWDGKKKMMKNLLFIIIVVDSIDSISRRFVVMFCGTDGSSLDFISYINSWFNAY